MMNFRTLIPIQQSPFSIDYHTPILSIGSCFAENIGQRLHTHHFPISRNPFGILYNPISIAQGLSMLKSEVELSPDSLFYHQECWHHFDFHSTFSNVQQTTALQAMRQSLIEERSFLEKTERLLLTFGTANVFVHQKSQIVVANCHKLPTSDFVKKRLTIEEIVKAFASILQDLKERCPNLEVILTVSPVRHVKDGLLENQRSKATLLLAIEQLANQFNFVHYFPAYELVLDDLRDYRFFEKDLVHPNDMAIDYVWDYFKKTYVSEATQQLLSQIQSVVRASQHLPFQPTTNAHQQFLANQLEKIAKLEKQYPFLRLSTERAIFLSQQQKNDK
ncbi:MAG: GSCFA domain-containing protein [Bacteroidota bacterium]